MTPIRVAVLAFNGISPFHLSVPCLVFGHSSLRDKFTLQTCSIDPAPLETSAGFHLLINQGLEILQDADIIIIPSWHTGLDQAPASLLKALQAAHQRGARLVGLCLGAFVLAEAGLLDECCATTHWGWAAEFARRFPKVKLDADVLYVDDGLLLTSAGTSAALDCCIHLLRNLCGSDIANRLARQLVMSPHRQGGQAQFIQRPLPADNTRDSRLGEVLEWVRNNLHLPHSLDDLAKRALTSRRSFTRHFRALTGTSLQSWLLAERLAFCQNLLENTALSIEAIATQCGFGSPVTLRFHFNQAFHVSPSVWRQNFHH